VVRVVQAAGADVRPVPAGEAGDHEASTRRQVLHLVVSRGPIAAGDLAAVIGLTAPAVRRHLAALEAEGHIAERLAPGGAGRRGRGRPARLFVATPRAHDDLPSADAALAVDALGYLAAVAGDGALRSFAATRSGELERRYGPAVEAAGPVPEARARALAAALDEDGYEATIRPVRGTSALQLCQGHCPVGHVAAHFPQLCEAETQAFSRLLGVHVQRLATLAGGGHACTTNVPTGLAPATPTPAEGRP
jgi:predicted ArsR family transcriptional regulator